MMIFEINTAKTKSKPKGGIKTTSSSLTRHRKLQNDTNRLLVTLGMQELGPKVKGELQDPLVSGQWLKAISTTVLESTKNERVYIKSITAIVDA
jgi:hypothetical protein